MEWGGALKLLLDTHAVIWWFAGDLSLSATARTAIGDPDSEVWVSAISALEIATKFRLGKLPEARPLALDFEGLADSQSFQRLSVNAAHAQAAGLSLISHKDPFDRILIAQAQLENMVLVSNEVVFDGFGVNRLW